MLTPDTRHIAHGREIPTESYSDQPFIVQTDDGAWLCCVTTGPGHEGIEGQHVLTLRSLDRGQSWSAPVSVEPGDTRENSYAVMLKVPSGRIYIFYNHNTDNVREILSHDRQQVITRVDSLGHFVCKYSDDHGKSWSAERFDIPFRLFQCDRENVYGGTLCFFWNVGKPFVREGKVYVSLIKVGQMGRGFFAKSEGVLQVSDNLLTERDPARIRWDTLPDGDIGLRTPPGGGPIAEEQSYCLLSDGSIYCVYRSIDGYPVESYSRDGGHTWSLPRYKCFADGRRMKHPRAANFVWRCRNGHYLYWFHNHGGRFIGEREDALDVAYEDRNPVWLSAGVEVETPTGREIAWSEPELILYDDDPYVRMSYPDLVEDDGNYYLTETQKDIARVHELPAAMLEEMWAVLSTSLGQQPRSAVAATPNDCLLALPAHDAAMPTVAPMPPLPRFRVRNHDALDYRGMDSGHGFALECWLTLPDLAADRVLLDNRDDAGRGFCLRTSTGGSLEITLSDGQTENHWASDPVMLAGRRQHVVLNIDGGPRIISFIIDGRFCDGGETRQFGWGRFSPYLRDVNGAADLRIAPQLDRVCLYGRVLRTSEAVAASLAHLRSTEQECISK
ncbi:MAG TPA: hypothetical protein VGL77_00055 [Armatimonadota bacterium]|jgi:hypothetical protein